MNSDLSIFETCARLSRERREFVLAAVVKAEGSTSAPVGSLAILSVEGEVLAGWIGGGCAASAVGFAATEAAAEKRSFVVEVDLDDDVLGSGLGCGGRMSVFVSHRRPPPVLWIFGAGRVADALCAIASQTGFSVNMAQQRDATDGLDHASVFSPAEALDRVGAEDFVVLVSQSFQDQNFLEQLSRKNCRYVGVMASHKRANTLRRMIAGKGCERSFVERLRAPAGLDLNAQTPEEIALEIAGELLQSYRGDSKRAKAQPSEKPHEQTAS